MVEGLISSRWGGGEVDRHVPLTMEKSPHRDEQPEAALLETDPVNALTAHSSAQVSLGKGR